MKIGCSRYSYICNRAIVKLSDDEIYINYYPKTRLAQWVKAFAPQAQGKMFESQPRQT